MVYHDVTGAAIAASTDDWYDHQEPLPDVAAPAADKTTGGVDASAEFVGWTTIPSSTGAGYAAITSPELASIKAQGELYQAGDPVEKPMDLYPVYTSYASNINLVVEGNELDGDVRANVRTDVAEAQVVATKVNGKNTYSIVVSGADETSTVDALPYGYRFKVGIRSQKTVPRPRFRTRRPMPFRTRSTCLSRIPTSRASSIE